MPFDASQNWKYVWIRPCTLNRSAKCSSISSKSFSYFTDSADDNVSLVTASPATQRTIGNTKRPYPKPSRKCNERFKKPMKTKQSRNSLCYNLGNRGKPAKHTHACKQKLWSPPAVFAGTLCSRRGHRKNKSCCGTLVVDNTNALKEKWIGLRGSRSLSITVEPIDVDQVRVHLHAPCRFVSPTPKYGIG